MHTKRLDTFTHRHLVWLLWLVLLLPIAQTAATWHVLSHVHSAQAEEDSRRQATPLDHCDLCLSAAALIGGAPLASSSALPQASVHTVTRPVELRGIVLTAPSRAYDSRAPPFPRH